MRETQPCDADLLALSSAVITIGDKHDTISLLIFAYFDCNNRLRLDQRCFDLKFLAMSCEWLLEEQKFDQLVGRDNVDELMHLRYVM